MKPYYQDGSVTIYHGDCRDVLPLQHDVMATDPPYGIQYRQPRKCKGRVSVVGDDRWTFTRPGVPFVAWGANNSPDYADCGWLVWDKERYGRDLYGDGEIAATNQVRGVHIFKSRWGGQHGFGWTGSHPTEKPVVLMEWCIGFLPEGVVLDPFMGSGSTLIASKNLGRTAIGIELDESYCEIAAKRCAQEVLALVGDAP